MSVDHKTGSYFLLTVVFSLTVHLISASCEHNAVGLADGFILDSQLTASSELNANTPAKNGRLNYTAGSSWCASTSESNPYLQIDLQTLYIICAVSTQGNSKGQQWVETYTLQLSTDGTTFSNYKGNGQSNTRTFNGNYNQNSTVKHILYSGIVARYLRFVSVVKHGGVCLRVEIFGVPRSKGNVALYKPSAQSSTITVNNVGALISSHAVDGGNNTHYSYCVHTDVSTNTNPWWRVDLGQVVPVAEVNILNRGDCCGTALNGAEIRVGNSTANGGANNHLCAGNIAVPQGKSKTFFCNPRAYGRYVYISLSGSNKYLMFCEVEVYSAYISNLALDQPAAQIASAHGGVASRAVDGNPDTAWSGGSCAQTGYATDPWWKVDLGLAFSVAEVVIVNWACTTTECINFWKSFEIRIGNSTQNGGKTNPSCGGTLSMKTGVTKSFYCVPPLVGRYVSVHMTGSRKFITLCEVQVYSTRRQTNNVTGCSVDPVGVFNSNFIRDQRFSASSSLSGSKPSNGRLKGVKAWIPGSNNNNNDYLQIDLGSVYFVCGVATQGNPTADDWTKTYKIETSLDNVNWNIYVEGSAEKTFTGNYDRTSIVRSELYEPLAAKFIRFYPTTFNSNKALRVEVYGSMQGCLSSLGNERYVNRNLGIFASSTRDPQHIASYSRLYGIASWCSSTVSPPQYLEVDFRNVITVTGVATQGDAGSTQNWVKKYAVSYGYDRKTWVSYAAGQFTGNTDKNTVVVNWFSSPFAAQYVRIIAKTFNNGICMRMDLFGCKDFQVPFLFVNKLRNVQLTAYPSSSVTLHCNASFSQQRPAVHQWRKDGTLMSVSSSSLTTTYISATDIHSNYHCTRQSSSTRDVLCSSTYQCTTYLIGMPSVKNDSNANVNVILKVPGQPTVQINPNNIKARSTSVTWTYSPGSDEMPINSYTLQYQNSTDKHDIPLSSGSSTKHLVNLKPYSSYSVRLMAASGLGNGLWSNFVNFTTKTATPEVSPRLINVTALTSQTIYVEWQKPNLGKVNGPLRAYRISYKEVGAAAKVATVPVSSTSYILTTLKKWTAYIVKITVYNGDYYGPWSPGLQTRTKQDAPSAPTNPQITVQGPSGNTRPRMTVRWGKPAHDNGKITRYTLEYSFTFEGKTTTRNNDANGQTFSYTFDVLGGIQYSVQLWAETIKPGPKTAAMSRTVPVYKPSIAPRNITESKMNETTFSISWDPLSREMSNGKVIAYEVRQTRVSSSPLQVVFLNTTDTFAVLSGLTSCSEYIVEVRAYTTAGPGVFGNLPRRIVTSAPGPPNGVRAETAEKRSITLLWSKPEQHGDDVKQYTIIYEGTKDYYPDFKHDGTKNTKLPNFKVDELYPGTKYSFVVIATTHCGAGGNSSVAFSQTLMDAPVAAVFRDVKVISTTKTSVDVTVWPALQTNGPISYYQLLVHRVKEEWTDKISDWNTFGPDFFIAAQIPDDSVNPSMVFVVGDGKTYGGYENKKLTSGHKYKIYSRALTKVFVKGGKGDKDCPSHSGKKENKECPSSPGTKTDVLALVISNSALGLLLSFSVGWNIWFWRTRRAPVKKTEEKYSPNDEEYEQVDAAVNKRAPGYDNAQPSQESLNYMELQPTRTTQEPTVADPQYMNTRPQYQSLAKRTQRNPNTKVACKNAGPKKNAEESDIYDEINA